MGNWYVAKDGNDANSGADWANAKLTITAAATAAANYDTIYVAGGIYYENVSINKSLTFSGVGLVIMDGGGSGTGIAQTYTSYDTVSVTGFWIRNYSTGIDVCNYSYWTLTDCRITDIGGWCVDGSMDNWGRTWSLTRCLFQGGNGVSLQARQGSLSISSCTIIATGTGIYQGNDSGSGVGTLQIRDSLISASIMINWYGLPSNADQTDYNCLDFSGGNKTTFGGTDYTTLATHQAGTGMDTSSLDSDPATELLDTAKGLYAVKSTSQLVRRGAAGANIGWGGPAIGISNNVNATAWNTPYVVSGSVRENASGHWELASGTSATIRFGDGAGNAMDLGIDRTIRYVRMSALETGPGSIIDYDIAEADPRQLTYRYKASATTFLLSDNTGWTEVNRDTDIVLSASDRYFAVEVTLRTDGP